VKDTRFDIERRLARTSADEIVAALGLSRAPALLRGALRRAFSAISTPLGRVLAHFDANIEQTGMTHAAETALAQLGARVARTGESPPPRGATLVVANHPGAYDALALIATLGRDDVAILAADRVFLRSMPALSRHLVFVPDPPAPPMARARGLLRAVRHLTGGGALLHFGAGRIEPDPAFPIEPGVDALGAWPGGTGALVRGAALADGLVVAAIVEGVHSRRAKRLAITRLAERNGLTTLAPLLQVALRPFRDVEATVHLGRAVPARRLAAAGNDAAVTEKVRSLASDLLAATPRA
jgi:hypothetical protein